MANNNFKKKSDELEEQVRAAQANLSSLRESIIQKCEHRPSCGGKLVSVHEKENRLHLPNKVINSLPEDEVGCLKCGTHFSGKSYSTPEIDGAVKVIGDMIEQIKLVANLSDADKEFIIKGYEARDTIERIARYYINMVSKMSNGKNNNNNRRKGTSKGHMGPNPNMFNNRGY
jgi:hypothetical protein